jgi:hypothetical protein
MRRGAAALLAATTTLAITGCAPGSGGTLDDASALAAGISPDASAADSIKTGQCFAGARLRDNPTALSTTLSREGMGAFTALGDQPTWTDPVECDQPHQIEVYGVVGLPPRVDASITSYADVLDPESAVYHAVDDEVVRGCALTLAPSTTATRSAPMAVDVTPFWAAGSGIATSWSAMPSAAWDGGDHAFACLFELDRPGTARLADSSTSDFPADARSCLMGSSFVACGQRHDEERIASVGLDWAVAQGQVAGARAVDDAGRVNLGAAAWATLDGVCQRYLDAVAPHHDAKLRGVANTYPELYPDAAGHYTVLCSARSAFGSVPVDTIITVGSVFAG